MPQKLLVFAQEISIDEYLEFEVIELSCPITGFRIIEPVMINQSSYERKAVIEKLEGAYIHVQ